ncbi:citryl-CoA lyase [Salipiger marinus]|uniref:citrate synthase (unknown stereospecificity) n=1 Tax=Salipiger marinus TaxID=555512 RepID=A0A1G8PAB8_9RHOB|nr:citryl-CoA lyase [Salipiger marinus]SDI89449.1 citrate synthase [Salipiger marinus]
MPKRKDKLTSDIGWSTPDQITVRGLDLPSEILGEMNLGDLAFLLTAHRKPSPEESKVFNAIVITLVEHGITPSAMVARLTYMGAPESLQAAVAAGLNGLGTVFVGSMEGAARLLYEALPAERLGTGADLEAIAKEVVADHAARGQILPGLGHPLHKPVDPRTPRLFEIAAQNGLSGEYVALMQCLQREAEAARGKALPINATGAIGAICCEFGFPWQIVRGFGVMARSIGLVGHILEERSDPIAFELWQRTEEEILRNSGPQSR